MAAFVVDHDRHVFVVTSIGQLVVPDMSELVEKVGVAMSHHHPLDDRANGPHALRIDSLMVILSQCCAR